GRTLREQDRQNFIVNPSTATVKTVGVFWHLRDAAGRMVVVQAGPLTLDLTTGELTKVTPNVDPDFAAVICPALGGSPASGQPSAPSARPRGVKRWGRGSTDWPNEHRAKSTSRLFAVPRGSSA